MQKMTFLKRMASSVAASLPDKTPNDVVLTWIKRTALTKAKKGGFNDTPADALLLAILKGAQQQAGFDTNLVDDIVVGVCHSPSPCYEARAAALAAGFDQATPVGTVRLFALLVTSSD
jgi:acetyl-CoA acyltransferase 1